MIPSCWPEKPQVWLNHTRILVLVVSMTPGKLATSFLMVDLHAVAQQCAQQNAVFIRSRWTSDGVAEVI
jgi:hypothetical protein